MMKSALGAVLVAAALGCSALATPSHASTFVWSHVGKHWIPKPLCTRGIVGCRHTAEMPKPPKPLCTRGIIGCR
jgi:hypothetical protein